MSNKNLRKFSQYLQEAADVFQKAKGFDNWRFPKKDELTRTATNLNYERAQQAKVIDLPAYLYKKDTSKNGLFEPYTRADITQNQLPSNAKKILQGFTKHAPMAYVTVEKIRGKYQIIDGNTRTAVAAPLGVKVKALVITPDMYDYRD